VPQASFSSPPRGLLPVPGIRRGKSSFQRPLGSPAEAAIYWKSYNYYEAEARARGLPLVRINMDETAVPVVPPPLKGVVMRRWRNMRFARPGRFQAGRNKNRQYLTYVAFVSDDHDLNRHLPQVVIGRKTILLQRDFMRLFNLTPDTVYLHRSDSGWNTGPVLREIYILLAKILQEHRPDHAYVLAFDCAACHMHAGLWALLRARGIYPVLVPAKTTWLLQPLDVHCFRYFKERLRRRFYDSFSERPAALTMDWFLPLLYEVILETIQQKPWPQIFRTVGLAALQSGVSSYIKAHLEHDTITAAPALPLSQDEVVAICPRNHALPAVVFGALPTPGMAKALPAEPPLALPAPPPPPEILMPAGALEHPYYTRRQRRRLEDSQGEAAPKAPTAAASSSSASQATFAAEAVPRAWPRAPPAPKMPAPRPRPPMTLPQPTMTPPTPKPSTTPT
jgi:hypothetical protein